MMRTSPNCLHIFMLTGCSTPGGVIQWRYRRSELCSQLDRSGCKQQWFLLTNIRDVMRVSSDAEGLSDYSLPGSLCWGAGHCHNDDSSIASTQF